MDPFSIAIGSLGIISALLTFGGQYCSLVDNISNSIADFRAFGAELEQLGWIWRQTQRQIKNTRLIVGPDYETGFLNFTETTNYVLQQAYQELRNFDRVEREDTRRQLSWAGALAAVKRVTISRGREERIQAFLNRSTVRVHRAQLATAKASLGLWLQLLG